MKSKRKLTGRGGEWEEEGLETKPFLFLSQPPPRVHIIFGPAPCLQLYNQNAQVSDFTLGSQTAAHSPLQSPDLTPSDVTDQLAD